MRKSLSQILLVASLTLGLAAVALPASALNVKLVSGLGAATTVKSSSAVLYGVAINGIPAAGGYLQLFNATGPTLGTTKPTLEIPAASTSTVVTFPQPIPLGGTALSAALTTASQGSTTTTANVTFLYQ